MVHLYRTGSRLEACSRILLAAALLAIFAGCSPKHQAEQSAAAGLSDVGTRPNILIIMADDLGYSDLGAFGGEISTPNIDALARQGRIYTNMYATPLCAITRAEVISGTDHHLVGLGTMGRPTDKQKGAVGYEGYLTDGALSIAEVLRDGGYHTYMAGKWHLGLQDDEAPITRGFESSYALLPGFDDHYPASVPTPAGKAAKKLDYRENETLVEPPADFYSTDFFTDRLISYIDAGHADGKPFFAYAAYTSPHWPLQAPVEFIERQRGRYDEGYDIIRQRRLKRQQELGIIPSDMQPATPLPESHENPKYTTAPKADFKTWESLSAEERAVEARRMEIYAAMVENLDWNVGRLIQHLQDIGRYDNTLIVFMSDNGAASYGVILRDTADIDNSFANLGRRGSYVTYTPRWAEVSNTPLSLWKQTPAEGGIAVPLIVRMPGQRQAKPLSRATVTVKDLAPTFAEFAGIAAPGSRYRGRDVFPWSGTSLKALFEGTVVRAHPEDAIFADEVDFEYYLRQGEWKALWMKPPYGSDALKLYNLRTDRGETTDLAAENPDVVETMTRLYEKYVQHVGVAR